MKKVYASLLGLVFVFIITTPKLVFSSSSLVFPSLEDVSDESVGSPLSSPQEEQELLLAKKGKEKYTCLEVCAKKRYQCETGNRGKNKVGTKKNWQESGKCEKKYRGCLDKCEVE